jgi:O-antigen/teichoic acid export membrane protein
VSATVRRTLKNTALLAAFEVANPLLSLLLIGTITRRLGADGLGAYNLLLSLFFIAHAFTSLGLNTLVIRDVARDRSAAGRVLWTASALGFAVSVVAGAAVLLSARWGGYGPDAVLSTALVALALFPSVVILFGESIFVACEQVHVIVLLAAIENGGRVAAGLVLVHAGFGVTALIASFTVLRFVTLAATLVVFRRTVGPLRWAFDAATLRDLSRAIPVFGGILVASTLYAKLDVFFLSGMTTLAAVGYYAAAYRLFTIAQVLPKSFNTSIFPVFSRLFRQSSAEYQRAGSLSIRYLLVVLIPLAAGVQGTAAQVVPLLFGAGFGPAVPALQVLIWTVVPYGIARILASALFATDRQAVDLKVNLLSLACNVTLNLVLIPRFGLMGCAWATLISMILFVGFQAIFLRGEISVVLREAGVIRILPAAAALIGWLSWTPSLPLALRIAGGAGVYVFLLFALQVVPWRDLQTLLPRRFTALLPEEREP